MTNHIKHIHDENKTWCGETVGNEFYFKSVDHAVLNGMGRSQSHTHLVTCEACTTVILENLIKGQQQLEPIKTEVSEHE